MAIWHLALWQVIVSVPGMVGTCLWSAQTNNSFSFLEQSHVHGHIARQTLT